MPRTTHCPGGPVLPRPRFHPVEVAAAFASTKEGSNKGDDRYSVRLIEGTDNEEGRRRLNKMYTLNRMLDGDPFYVKIAR
ncbi:hypothetical protein [Streptomyces sp. NPDC059712]|uniref:hypothetical protein n=1 Tax=Streptomyces sp. NPDC059712 TaxID=3346919 RepID=UPI0036B0BE3E